METFGYKNAYKFQGVVDCAYPLIALGAIGAIYIFVVMDSGGMFAMKDWTPFAAIGLAAWFIYELYQASKLFSFNVKISDAGIQVGKSTFHSWDQVEKAEFHGFQIGSKAVITLHLKSNEELKIPAAIDHLEYIQGIIENKVQNIINPKE